MVVKYTTLSIVMLVTVLLWPGSVVCADVLIIGDTQQKPVVEIISAIRKSLKSSVKIVSPSESQSSINRFIAFEDVKVVIALGKDATDKATQLPPAVPVICSLIIAPPNTSRSNTAFGLITTPVSEYLQFIHSYLPALRNIASISSPEMFRTLRVSQEQIAIYQASTSYEFVTKIKQLNGVNALLLLPDVSLLTATAMDEVYLYSFRNRVPVIGVSEKHVRQGSLFALVFDSPTLGRQIGEKAAEALSGTDLGKSPPFTVTKFNLYVNTDTAQKMGISMPSDLLRRARKIYP